MASTPATSVITMVNVPIVVCFVLIANMISAINVAKPITSFLHPLQPSWILPNPSYVSSLALFLPLLLHPFLFLNLNLNLGFGLRRLWCLRIRV